MSSINFSMSLCEGRREGGRDGGMDGGREGERELQGSERVRGRETDTECRVSLANIFGTHPHNSSIF